MRHPILRSLLPAILLATTASAADAQMSSRGSPWAQLAEQMDVRFAILDNSSGNCPAGNEDCFRAEITLTLPEQLPPAAERQGVKIYYGFVTRLLEFRSDTFQDRLINGDLHELSVRPGQDLKPGSRHVLHLVGRANFFSKSYVMPNFYLVTPSGEALVLRATVPVIDRETGHETLPFVQPMTNEAKLARGTPADLTQWRTPIRDFDRYAAWDAALAAQPAMSVILPTPLVETGLPGDALDLRGGMTLALRGVNRSDLSEALARIARDGVRETQGGVGLSVSVDPKLRLPGLSPEAAASPERYRITVSSRDVAIEAASAAAASAALFGLSQQIAHDGGVLRPMRIEDAPRFGFRGLHIDIARNFHGPTVLTGLLDQMARYKLNRLHLHLADDEGWRLEIPELPELAQVGGFRCHDLAEDRCLLPQLGAGPDRDAPQNGYLTRSDYMQLLKAARARHIEVIPSFDMPGHSRAAIRSMEARYRRLMEAGDRAGAERYRLAEPGDTTQYRSIQNYNDNTLNPCLPATFRFFDTVVGALQAMHAQAGVPLKIYHIGADETAGAWIGSPACRKLAADGKVDGKATGAMFIERVSKSLSDRGIIPAGWSDGMGHADPANMPAQVQANVWAMLLSEAPQVAHTQANLGWRTVISVPDITYLDHPQAADPDEPGYDWASRSTDLLKVYSLMPENLPANASIVRDLFDRPVTTPDTVPLRPGARPYSGMQGHLWTETVRTDGQVEYMLFPRLLAIAERAWRRAPWEPAYVAGQAYAYGDGKVDRDAIAAGWHRFRGRLAYQMPLLDRDGVAYRVAPPGAKLENGKLVANTELPGMAIEWRGTGMSEWQLYQAPVAVRTSVEVRARSADGRRASRSVTVMPD